MDCLTSVGEAIRVVKLLIQHFKDISPETNSNRLFLINRLKRDRVQPYPSLCSPEDYPTVTNTNFISELLHYCRAAFVVYGSYEARYTLNHDPFELPTMNSDRVRKHAARYYRHKNNRFGPTSSGKRAQNIFELNTFAACMGVSPLDVVYYTTRARYFMPCAAVYLDHRRYEIVVAIRGSYSLADMVTDIFCMSTEFTAPPEKFELLVKASSRDKFVTDIDTETIVQQKTKVDRILKIQPRMYVRSQTLKKAKRARGLSMSKIRSERSIGQDNLGYGHILDHVTPGPAHIVEKKKKRYQILSKKLKSKDLLIKPITDYTKYYGHAGMYAASAYIYHDTYKVLLDTLQQYPRYYLTFTGHSLGGAVSMLMGWYWSHHVPYQRIKVVGFCSPPCGNKLLCDLLSSYGFINVCMQSDFGPRISPKGFLFAFRRLGLLSEIQRRRKLNKEIKDTRHDRRGENLCTGALPNISFAIPSHVRAGRHAPIQLDQAPEVIVDTDNVKGSRKRLQHAIATATAARADAAHSSSSAAKRESLAIKKAEILPRDIYSAGDYLTIGASQSVVQQTQDRQSRIRPYDPASMALSTPNPLSKDVSEYCPMVDVQEPPRNQDGGDDCLAEPNTAVVAQLKRRPANEDTNTNTTLGQDQHQDTDHSESFKDQSSICSSTYSDMSKTSSNFVDVTIKRIETCMCDVESTDSAAGSEICAKMPGSELVTSFAIANLKANPSEPDLNAVENPDIEATQRLKKLFMGEMKKLKSMTDDELKHEYTSFVMNYTCPDEDINTYVLGIQYVIAFNYGNKVKSFRELRMRQKELGVERYSTLRMFSAPPEIYNELIFDGEMFDHHLLIYQGILLLYYNMLNVYSPIPWGYTRGGQVKTYPIVYRMESALGAAKRKGKRGKEDSST